MAKFCTSCGAALEEGAQFCGDCRKPVNHVKMEPEESSQEQVYIPQSSETIREQHRQALEDDFRRNIYKKPVTDSAPTVEQSTQPAVPEQSNYIKEADIPVHKGILLAKYISQIILG
jgi:hypothetical protein